MKSGRKRSPKRSKSSATSAEALRILAIDIGGTGLKAAVVDKDGRFLSERNRIPTPHPSPPKALLKALDELVEGLPRWNRISIGFPGYVKKGRIVTAPNLGTKQWSGYALEEKLANRFKAPAKLVNDADMQGLAVISGKGLEFVVTLGTGFGTAFFKDGEALPHLEIAHLPIRHGMDYDAYIGDKTRKKIGNAHWNRRVARVFPLMHTLLNYDRLLIGGGNSRRISFRLPKNARLVSNDAGLEGGAALWHRLTGRSLASRRRGTP
jgi:polyphosphate glucokinase